MIENNNSKNLTFLEDKIFEINPNIKEINKNIGNEINGVLIDSIDIKLKNIKNSNNFEKSCNSSDLTSINDSVIEDENVIEIKYSKIYPNSSEALKDIKSKDKILIGGFALCGAPENLIRALENRKNDLTDLTVVSSNAGMGDYGLGLLIKNKQIKRIISSYVGENSPFEKQYFGGELEVEFVSQGILSERLRAAGSGIPAFYTKAGVGTAIEFGGFPVLYSKDKQTVLIESEKRERREFNSEPYILEHAITGDFAIIKGWKADKKGNVIFRKTARNFNYDCAIAAKITIVEVEEIVENGQLDPDQIHLPGIYVDRIVKGEYYDKKIEKIRIKNPDDIYQVPEKDRAREIIARRVAMELKEGMYVNLGVGIPVLVPNFVSKDLKINFHSEIGMIGTGSYPTHDKLDADLINASRETVSETPGCVYLKSSDSFGMIRGGHLDLSVLGALQVSKNGDISNWIVPGILVKGMGGAMDLVSSGSKVIVAMTHLTKFGDFKILDDCVFPLTGSNVVSKLITDMCVFDFLPETGMTLVEIYEGVSLENIIKSTGCKFSISEKLVFNKKI